MQVTIFQNFNKPILNQSISDVLTQIKSVKYKNQIASLQKLIVAGKTEEYNQQKKSLPAFTPSGTFVGGRKMQFFKEYSGLIILDFDKLSADQLASLYSLITSIPYTFSFFKSPSGNGCKILVKVSSTKENHLHAFLQVSQHYEKALSLQVDPSGKDITRLCFFSHDPDLYHNPEASVFTVVTPSVVEGPHYKNNTIQDDIENIISQIESQHIDITTPYDNWVKLCFALIDALGSNARDYFHRISRINHEYDFTKCDKQFDHCLNRNNSGISVKTFFGFAKDHGITSNKVQQSLSLLKRPLSVKTITQQLHKDNTTITPASNSLGLNTDDTEQQNEITGKKSKTKTNKFHLVRDYLSEHFDIRYNSVSTEFEYKEKDKDEYQPLNENNIFIKMCLDGLSFSLNNLMAFLKSDLVPRYNPFTQYFESLPAWDGVTDHIQKLASFVNLKHDICDRFDNHFKKWLVRTVKCAMIDSYFNKQAFILVHDKQNSGKSTFCRFLCPPKLSNYIAENLSIDKDSRILLTTNLLINLDELSTLSKVEINSLKSLFSKDKINDRLPYDRKNSIIPRRASFIGSTNQAEFLNDESGSVRWLCFVIEKIDWSYKEKINIDDVWAQAFHLFKTHFACDLSPDEIKENEEYNRQFHITTSEFELIHKYLEPAKKDLHDCFMSATDILLFLAEKTDNKVKLNSINIGRALKMLSFTRDKKYPERNYGYYVYKKNA